MCQIHCCPVIKPLQKDGKPQKVVVKEAQCSQSRIQEYYWKIEWKENDGMQILQSEKPREVNQCL